MKILMLVISSDTSPVNAHHRDVWRTYMHSHPDVECVFIQFDPITFVPRRTQDTLLLRGIERYGTIFKKTVDSMHYFMSRRLYDYVVRTNLSSVWDFRNLVTHLKSAPRERYYAGQIGTHPSTGLQFASGAGFIMSADVARTLLVHQETGRYLKEYDDVAVASVLSTCGIFPVSLPRVDFESLAHYDAHHDAIPPGSLHFRMKHHEGYARGDRMEEPRMMHRLVQEHILPR
jgi:hypothetical protein